MSKDPECHAPSPVPLLTTRAGQCFLCPPHSHRIQPSSLRPCLSGTHDQTAGRIGSNQVMKEHYGPLIAPYEIFRCNLPAEGFLPSPVGASTGLIRDDRFHPRGGDFGVDEKAWQGGSRHTWPCHAMAWRVPQQHWVSRRSWSWSRVGRELCRCEVDTR